jgi:hypothetical protein
MVYGAMFYRIVLAGALLIDASAKLETKRGKVKSARPKTVLTLTSATSSPLQI